MAATCVMNASSIETAAIRAMRQTIFKTCKSKTCPPFTPSSLPCWRALAHRPAGRQDGRTAESRQPAWTAGRLGWMEQNDGMQGRQRRGRPCTERQASGPAGEVEEVWANVDSFDPNLLVVGTQKEGLLKDSV